MEIAEHRHSHRTRVLGAGVRALYIGRVIVILAALYNGAVAANQIIIPDVIPALAVHVISLNRPYPRRAVVPIAYIIVRDAGGMMKQEMFGQSVAVASRRRSRAPFRALEEGGFGHGGLAQLSRERRKLVLCFIQLRAIQ